MAGLFDTIKSKSGQLAKTSTEELAKQTGLPAQLTTPVGNAVLGANPHQAKMAGTPNQKTSALRQSIQGTQDLDTATREKQARNIATTSEQSEVNKSQGLQGLGGLQDRVNDIAKTKLAAGAKAAASSPAALTTATSTIAGMPELVNKLKANPQDQATLASIAQLLHPGQALTPDEVSHLVSTDTAAGIAQKVDNNVKASELPGDVQANIKKALPGADLNNMTIEQLQDAIQQEIDAEMSQVSDINQKMGSVYTGEAERGAALSDARDLGAVGVTSAENQAQSVNQQIQQGDTITFMGKQVPLSTFLSDDNIANVVRDFITNPNSDTNKQLAEQNPDFTKFVSQYKDTLEAAVKDLAGGVAEQQKTVASNAALKKVDLGDGMSGELSDDLMKAIFPDWGKVTGKAFDANQSPLLNVLRHNNIPAGDRKSFINLMNDHPEFAAELSKLPAQDLERAMKGDGQANLQSNVKTAEALKGLDAASPDLVKLSNTLGFKDFNDMKSNIEQSIALASHSGNRDKVIADLKRKGIAFTVAKSGQVLIDAAATIKGLKSKAPGTVLSMVNQQSAAQGGKKIADTVSKAPELSKKMASAAPDGRVDSALEVDKLFNSGKVTGADGLKDITQFVKSGEYQSLPAASKKLISDKAAKFAEQDEGEYLSKQFNLPKGTSLSVALNKISNMPATTDVLNLLNKAEKQAAADRDANPLADKTYEHSIRKKLEALRDKVEAKVNASQQKAEDIRLAKLPKKTPILGQADILRDEEYDRVLPSDFGKKKLKKVDYVQDSDNGGMDFTR